VAQNFFTMLASLAPDHLVEFETHHAFADAVSQVCPTLNDCTPLDRGTPFKSKGCCFESDDVTLAAFLSPKVHSEVGCNDSLTLNISLLGHNTSRVNGRNLAWGSGSGALYTPLGSAIEGEEGGCTLTVNLDPQRLRQTIEVMLLASEQKVANIDFETPRIMPRSIGRLDLAQALKQIYMVAGQYAAISEGIARMGCDDMIYRHAALMFHPTMFGAMCADAPPADKNRRRRQIDDLCDLLKFRLGDQVSVTDMERLSGMSARTLQSAFMARFGVSPIQWLRQQRLDFARQTLLHANLDTTVIQVALSSGFASPSKFSMYYKQRFGEPPSATLAKALAS
jgi:AraC-like DNA-binding protein